MPNGPGELPIEQKLSAFVDGELNAAQRLEMLEFLAGRPEAMNWVRDQQRISLAAQRVFDDRQNKAPQHLRDKILNLEVAAPLRISRWSDTITRSRSGWGTALAACVLIAIGATIARMTLPLGTVPTSLEGSVVPASLVAHATRIHADCSRLAERLHSAAFPRSQGVLASNVERDLHSSQPYPNLAPIGFRYVGAGPCGDAMQDSIHLLYHSMTPGSISTISLFVQPNRGQFSLNDGEVYNIAGSDSPYPMLCWRTESVVYFLIADSQRTERKALSLIRSDVTAASTVPSTMP